MIPIAHVEVVVPARNEEQRIRACVRSVLLAARRLQKCSGKVGFGVTVVLDCCTDRTEEQIVGTGVRILESAYGRVGGARSLGIADTLDRLQRSGVDSQALWIACTDADSVVPEDWLEVQMQLANSGMDAVIGTVTPSELGADMYRLWRENYQLVEGHHHVHGANLGIRASTYRAAGGFTAADVDEDVDLVRRVRTLTDRWTATHRISVVTSGRSCSHVDGGFATYVDKLTSEAT